MFVQSLEPRRLLTGVTHTGTLVVDGTDQNDKITVSRKNGTIFVHLQPQTGLAVDLSASAASVKRVLVLGNGGDDTITVQNIVNERATLAGGAGNDRLLGNYGSTLIGGSGDDYLVAPPRSVYDVDTKELSDNPDKPQVVALLSGGLGNDTLAGDRHDDFVGGKGTDRAGIALNFKSTSPFITYNSADEISDDTIRENASGVELFNGDDSLSIVTNTGGPTNEAG